MIIAKNEDKIAVKKSTPKGRFYTTPEGKQYPSVTTILQVIGKPALINWAASEERKMVIEAAADMYVDISGIDKPMSRPAFITSLTQRIGKTKAHQKMLKKAGEIGSQAHALIEWNIRKALGQKVGIEPEISDKANWAFSVWQKWAASVNFKPLFLEQTIHSNIHQYAGTLDMLAEIETESGLITAVVDWKTGKAIYDEALLQNAAYIHAVIEMGHHKSPISGIIVRLPKNEKDPDPEIRIISWTEHAKLMRSFLHARALWGWQYGNGKK